MELFRRVPLAVVLLALPATLHGQMPGEPASSTPASSSSQPSSAPAEPEALPDAPGATASVALQPTGPTAVFDTTMGRITCKLFDKEAPQASANFIGLAEGTKDWVNPSDKKPMHGQPLYNGTIFHRVIPGFMIQGGDPMGNGMGDPGYYFADEINPDLNFDVAGRLAMANSGPNTNGSQFFITEEPQEHLNQHYTLFGQCDEASVLIVKTISRVQRSNEDKPITPVVLKKVTIVREGQPIPALPPQEPAATPAASPISQP